MLVDALKAAALLFAAVIVQVTILNGIVVFGGTPDVLLVTLVALALLRGSVFGGAGGFFAGFLVDSATLQTLGLTSLLLTLAGYWTGRYGETTGRDRTHAPLVAVAVITLLYSLGALALRYVLGETADGRAVLDALLPTIVCNLLIAAPLYALCRRFLGLRGAGAAEPEVRLLG